MKRQTRRAPAPPNHQPPPTPQYSTHHRDSDASFTSSRPSSSFNLPPRNSHIPNISDPSFKHSALRSVNAFLSSHGCPLSLSLKPLPSAKDLTDTLKFLLSKLDFVVNPGAKLEDELFSVLKFLNCPHKINKSAFRAPGAPHSFPLILAVIHWLVQVADFKHHLSSDNNSNRYWFKRDNIMAYCLDSYLAYMEGADEDVELLDKDLAEKMENESNLLKENLNSMDEEIKQLELEQTTLKSTPSERDTLERQRKDLEADLDKFQGFVASLQDANSLTVSALEEKEKELAAKVVEIRRIKEENEELKKKVEAQGINMRDAERMKRELMSAEREISEAESSRSSWEEKCWDLDSAIGQKFKELESLSIECNQALRRIKLGGDFQYRLNAKGSSVAEVLGINYKTTLKPAINAFVDDIKKSTTGKLEEFITLQQHSKEMNAKIEAKQNRLSVLQSHIDDKERQLEMIRNEIDEYASRCASEAEKIVGDVEVEVHNLVNMESEALATLRDAELKLEEETRQSKEETQCCAYELFALIDSVSKYKEHVEKKISEMKRDLSETTEFISSAYKNTLSSELNIDASLFSSNGSSR
ncbi:kinetochore protein NDC80 homolog [Silene latifolia]|uniref:kinetochore protein NDC80 homolog n=1 Tax=Silene latifolia TaxID=37657 RepID=UPI003D773251